MDQLSLRELNEIIKATLDTHLEPSYWVIAEIGELRVNQRGHCYMELVQKEDDNMVAKIRGNIWSYTYRNLSGWFEASTGESLKPGMKILANVMVQFHEIYGISLTVRDIDVNFTLGERARKRQEIIDRLRNEGLLDKNKLLTLPLVPQRIAIISSPTAAGFGDFQDQLINNNYGYFFRIQLFRSLMQGEGAVEEIILALERIEAVQEEFDIVVIIRGGGSQVDLDCFDSFELCSKIAGLQLPVITGIGHERDQTIADIVANTSLKTPTAVGEFLINGILQFDSTLEKYLEKLTKSSDQKYRFEELRLNEYHHQLKRLFHMSFKNKEHRLENIQNRLLSATKFLFNNKSRHLEQLITRLSLLDPEVILRRGYTITSVNNKFISKAGKIRKGDKLKTYTDKYIIDSTVDNSKSK